MLFKEKSEPLNTFMGKSSFLEKEGVKIIGELTINDIYPNMNCIEIYSFQVLSKFWQHGIGKNLMSRLIKYARQNKVSFIQVAPGRCNDLEEDIPDDIRPSLKEIVEIYKHLGFYIHHDSETSPIMRYDI